MLSSAFSLVSHLKEKARRVRKTSWHFKVVESLWGHRVWHTKACKYWWIMVPTSLFVLGLVYLIGGIMYTVGFLLGYAPRPESKKYSSSDDRMFMPHGELPSGRKWPWYIQPWFMLAVFAVFWFAVSFPETFWWTVGWIVKIVVVVVLVGFVVYLLGKGWNLPGFRAGRRTVRRQISGVWDKVCPSLVVVQNGDDRVNDTHAEEYDYDD